MDGFQVQLPRSDDVLKRGFQGRWVSQVSQQHYPCMYTVMCVDVLSETIEQIRHQNIPGERRMAREMIPRLEKNSVCLYDRGLVSKTLILEHEKAGNSFIFRLPKKSYKEADELRTLDINRRTSKIAGVEVHFVKAFNPKSKEFDSFVTNLPVSHATPSLMRSYYNLRWEVENTFQDMVKTVKLEQWHSKYLNGILQELYATLWLYNYTKGLILLSGKIQKSITEWRYQKANFKLIYDRVARNLGRIFKKLLDIPPLIARLIRISTAARERHSRAKDRFTRGPKKSYEIRNTVLVLVSGMRLK